MAPKSGKVVITYKGATPAGGLSDELLLSDPKNESDRLLLVKDQPSEPVDSKWVKIAEAADHQRIEVEDAPSSASASEGSQG